MELIFYCQSRTNLSSLRLRLRREGEIQADVITANILLLQSAQRGEFRLSNRKISHSKLSTILLYYFASLSYSPQFEQYKRSQMIQSALLEGNYNPITTKMSHDILSLQGRKPQTQPIPQEQEDVECVQTKIWLWQQDSYEQFQSDYLNQIFPYKINKKTMTQGAQFIFHFLSSSLHYWVELQDPQSIQAGKLSSKDSKAIQDIFDNDQCDNWIAFKRWGERFGKQNDWLKREQQQQNYAQPQGKLLHTYTRGQDEFQLVQYYGNDKAFNAFKKRLQVLLLFYIDGVSFVFEELDTWVYYVIYKKIKGKKRKNVVGLLSKYVFRLSAVKERHRVSQVFILPPYQKAGHGKELLDFVYKISLEDQNCFEITTQIPSFEYQCLRDYKELELLLSAGIFDLSKISKTITKTQIDENRAILLTKDNVRNIKNKLKIPGHQIQRLTNTILYHKILQQNDDMARAHFQQDIRDHIVTNRSPFKTRRKLPSITFFGQVPNLKEFMLEKAKEDMLRNQEQVTQILLQTINGFNRVISKLKKNKML